MEEIQSYPLDLQRLQFYASLLHHQKVESNRLKCFHGLDNQTQTKIQDFEQNSFLEKTNISRFFRILKFKNVHKNTSSIVLSKKNCAHFILLSQIPGRARNTPAESQELAMQLGGKLIHGAKKLIFHSKSSFFTIYRCHFLRSGSTKSKTVFSVYSAFI